MRIKMNNCDGFDEQQRIVAYRDGLQAKVNALREWWLSSPERSLRGVSKPQSATGEELHPFFGRTLMPSILDKAFKGEL